MRPAVVVLLEGESDRVALQTLAPRLGHDLTAYGVTLVPMGGITNTRAYATRHGPLGAGARLLGLYDVGEESHLRRGLVAAGLPAAGGEGDLVALGFHACVADLEDELLRALGVAGVESVIAAAGESRSLARLAQMPAQRGWSREDVLRRFLTSRSGRKARYAELLADALPLPRVPPPLQALLDDVVATAPEGAAR